MAADTEYQSMHIYSGSIELSSVNNESIEMSVVVHWVIVDEYICVYMSFSNHLVACSHLVVMLGHDLIVSVCKSSVLCYVERSLFCIQSLLVTNFCQCFFLFVSHILYRRSQSHLVDASHIFILQSVVTLNYIYVQQVAQLSLTNPRDVLHHDKLKYFLNSHVTITTPFCW